jgi:hypothetical protein
LEDGLGQRGSRGDFRARFKASKPVEDLGIVQIRRPVVGGEDSFVELAVGQVEPGGTLVVEVGQRPRGEQLGALLVLRDQARVADGADAAFIGIVDAAGPSWREPPRDGGLAGEKYPE